MKKEINTKVIAIAKDEAPYLPSWIFHHLYFGFDEVEIITNRTTDNSKEILNKISAKFTKVKHSDCDWIDLCEEKISRNLQKISYAYAYSKAKKEGFTHILFIDIDEFWTPLNLKTNIEEFINSKKTNASISFQWLCELGLEHAFSHLQKEGFYILNPHVKTLIHRDAEFSKIRIHTPDFVKNSQHILADGNKYIPHEKNPELCHPKTLDLKAAFVIHRIYRSPREYISTLARGNPESRTMEFKENRDGFLRNHPNKISLNFDQQTYDKYIAGLHNFTSTCEIEPDLHAAREKTLNRSHEAVKLINSPTTTNPETIRKIFSGVQINEVTRALENLPKEPNKNTATKKSALEAFERLPHKIRSPMDAGEILREVAMSFESCQDYKNAYEAMHIASIFRPDGPIINSKKSLYKSKIIEKNKESK